MIIAIGVDIVEISRIQRAMEKSPRFLERILRSSEIKRLMDKGLPVSSAAGYFAAKEAVSKVLGTGIGKIAWHEIEICHDDAGAPGVTLFGSARQIADRKGIDQILVSISHDRCSAIATALGQKMDTRG
ncbi:holo-ACP synthase [Anoxynatronum buryatiense]|uniref:Holo-[acyl-carrier-protein] synthase n=1 Tax=Anoxynatronum buryatiense TaxID=489973 RepID=A0AA45WUT9_9CLOT|nr:holo-ACP synthase [Anoxynatronum buryatiense]SMP45159.1 holo-[acyl-carrier-protein] synthase [Anoxynatronum buryatiense]